MYEFKYHRPATVRQAANLLVKNEDAKVIAGGHTLVPVMKQRLASPPHLVDLSHIEGLAEPSGPLHPMQEAFREHHGLQCGYCTPGMIMTAVDMVNRKGNDLDDPTIRHELEGNLCRCTGYHNIVKAIAAGAKAMGKGQAQPAS